MRSQLRLRVLVPVLAVALGGLGAWKFVLGDSAVDASEPARSASDRGAESASEPSATSAIREDPTSPEQPIARTGSKASALERALERRPVVVAVVYSPGSAVDRLVLREARLGAADVEAGFLAVNASAERALKELVAEYDVRETPALLVFKRGPELATTILGYADRETIAQAAENARA